MYWEIDDARVIGLPIPGVSIKLASDPSGKRELRVKGPNITNGYYKDEQASMGAFDRDGYYRTGDAGQFLNPDDANAGLIFDGRIGEDFKLTSGVWVHNASLRTSINRLGQPYLLDVVVAAPDKEFLTALIYPNMPVLREKFPDVSVTFADDGGFLGSQVVTDLFREVFKKHNQAEQGSSKRFVRFAILTELPQIDKNETTDKGYINQSAVLSSYAGLVEQLYVDPPPEGICEIS